MSLYSSVDEGDAIIVDGIVYTKIGQVLSLPVTNPDATIDHISSITFDRDDDNVIGGSAHRTWTASQVAVSYLPENYGTWGYGGSGQGNSTPAWTCPAHGVVRGCITSSCRSTIWKNGYNMTGDLFANVGFVASLAVRVSLNDVISIHTSDNGGTAYLHFLPYIY